MTKIREHPAGPATADIPAASGGVGRSTSAAAEAVSDALRREDDPYLRRRRRAAALTLTSVASLGLVAAYQNGLIRHLPEPPLPWLDADRVDASGEAYQYFKTPDSALGIASAAATLILIGMGGADRRTRQRWIPVALAAKGAVDAVAGAYLTVEQATKHRKFCSWCLVAAVANIVAAPQMWPEARAALSRRSRSPLPG